MADLDLYDEAPEFGVQRHDSGDVELTIRAEGTRIRITLGRLYDNASLLAESLRHLAEDVAENVADRWEDRPDEYDGYISFGRGRHHVSLEGKPVGDYPSRDVAEIELARAMVAGGVFPNAWFITDHGNYAAIDEDTLGLHAQAVREDRILDEVAATDGDVRRICDLFGLSVGAALRYAATADHSRLIEYQRRTTPPGGSSP